MRAIRARYDPYEQTRGRVEQLKSLGHNVDKVCRKISCTHRCHLAACQVEFIIMGGTFMSMPEEYRNAFIAQLHNALSGFTGLDVDEAVRRVPRGSLSCKSRSLNFLRSYSELSKSKAIGITIETRPDYCLRPHLR